MDLRTHVTATQGATLAGVKLHTLLMWVQAGKLEPVGTNGRHKTYRLDDVLNTERDTRRSFYSHRAAA